MSIRQRLGAVVVALFAVAFTRAPALIRGLNPLMRRLLAAPLPMGPNALLEVRGRRSGVLRSSPVAFAVVADRVLVQAASAEDAWVRNLRAAGEAVLVRRGRREACDARELDALAGGDLLHRVLAPLPRSALVRTIVGPTARPPVGVLLFFGIRVDDTLEADIATAGRQPIFELIPERSRWAT